MEKNFSIETKVDWKSTLQKFSIGDVRELKESMVNLESLRTAASYMKRTSDMEFSVNKFIEEGTGIIMVSITRNK